MSVKEFFVVPNFQVGIGIVSSWISPWLVLLSNGIKIACGPIFQVGMGMVHSGQMLSTVG